ncbi:sialate O-acetylesterase [Planctomycetaceae bacterium SH139]
MLPAKHPVQCSIPLLFVFLTWQPLPAQSTEVVKVFVLAGQSNMEGKAPNALYDHQATSKETAPAFAHLRDGDRWIERSDVFIKFGNRHGPLTLGYGSPNRTGPELEFGHVIGNHFDEPVLLIKTAWGGRSLYKDFRPPSAGLPNDEALNEELKKAISQTQRNNEQRQSNDPLPTLDDVKAQYGSSYREMMAEVSEVAEHYQTLFPELADTRFELSGFVWFQGWNDQYNGYEKTYEQNLAHLIDDVRTTWQRPQLPVVIAAMGQHGSKPVAGPMQIIQSAQLGIASRPEFAGSVQSIRTDSLVDKAAEQLYPSWKENVEVWQQTGGDHPYHYLGSAIWFNRIGHGMGEAMLELLQN